MPPALNRRRLRNIIEDLGLPGGRFTQLIDRAIRGAWTPDEFLLGVRRTVRRSKMFPGLFEKGGGLNPALQASTLGGAIANWRGLQSAVGASLQRLGFASNVTRKMMGTIIRNNLSPDEVAQRVLIEQAVESNQEQLQAFNAYLKATGRKPLDPNKQREFLGGFAARELYDLYEASVLQTSGLNLDAESSLRFARELGAPGELTGSEDISQIVAQVRARREDIGPELDRQGITDEDLLRLAKGSDPKGIEPLVRGFVAQRRALGARRSEARRGQQGTGGGLSLFQEEGQAAPD